MGKRSQQGNKNGSVERQSGIVGDHTVKMRLESESVSAGVKA